MSKKPRMVEVTRAEFIEGMTAAQVARMDAVVEADVLETVEALARGEWVQGVSNKMSPQERVAIIMEADPRKTVSRMMGKV